MRNATLENALISTNAGQTVVRVLATDEEQMIARSACQVLNVNFNNSDETQSKEHHCSSS